jgi:hypothetical protein
MVQGDSLDFTCSLYLYKFLAVVTTKYRGGCNRCRLAVNFQVAVHEKKTENQETNFVSKQTSCANCPTCKPYTIRAWVKYEILQSTDRCEKA